MISDDLELDIDTGEDPVEWVLDTTVEQWPGPEFPESIERFDRRDARSIDSGVQSEDFDLEGGISFSVGFGDRVREPMGLEWGFRIETILSVRVEAKVGSDTQYGHVDGGPSFSRLVSALQEAHNRERKRPDIDGGDVVYHSLHVENESDNSDDHRNYLRADWDVRLVGNECRDD